MEIPAAASGADSSRTLLPELPIDREGCEHDAQWSVLAPVIVPSASSRSREATRWRCGELLPLRRAKL